MRKHVLLASTLLALGVVLPSMASAQSHRPTSASDQGTLVYQADYFAPYNPNNAADMVARIPGFSVNDGDSSRGFEGAVGNVLINGSRPASKSDTGSSVLTRTQASRVERIELIRGGVPGIEMQGYAVVVNVILKGDASREQTANFNISHHIDGPTLYGGNYQYSETRGDVSWGIRLSDEIRQSDSSGDGRSIRVRPDGTVLRDEDYTNTAHGGGNGIRGTWTGPLLRGNLDATARLGIMDWHERYLATADNIERLDTYDQKGHSGELGLTYKRNLATGWDSETRFIHTFEKYEDQSMSDNRDTGGISPTTRFSADNDSSETILRSLVRHQRGANLDFEFGGELAYNVLEHNSELSIGGNVVPVPSSSVKVEEVRGQAMAASTWRIHPHWTLEGGLRLEHSTISQSGGTNEEESFFFAKPRVLLTWAPRPSTQVRMRVEKSVGQLDFADFAASAQLQSDLVIGGNAYLQPEQRWISELTFEQRFWEDGALNIGLRHDEIDGVIDYMPLPGGHSARGNIGNGTLDQLYLNLTVPMDRVGFSRGKFIFKNTWINTEVVDPTSGEKRPISGLRPTQPTFTLTQTIPSWKLQWSAAWMPRMGTTSYSPDRINGWRAKHYVEAWAEYKPRTDLSLRMQVNYWDQFNAFRTAFTDHESREVAFYETRPTSPRTFIQLRVLKTF